MLLCLCFQFIGIIFLTLIRIQPGTCQLTLFCADDCKTCNAIEHSVYRALDFFPSQQSFTVKSVSCNLDDSSLCRLYGVSGVPSLYFDHPWKKVRLNNISRNSSALALYIQDRCHFESIHWAEYPELNSLPAIKTVEYSNLCSVLRFYEQGNQLSRRSLQQLDLISSKYPVYTVSSALRPDADLSLGHFCVIWLGTIYVLSDSESIIPQIDTICEGSSAQKLTDYVIGLIDSTKGTPDPPDDLSDFFLNRSDFTSFAQLAWSKSMTQIEKYIVSTAHSIESVDVTPKQQQVLRGKLYTLQHIFDFKKRNIQLESIPNLQS